MDSPEQIIRLVGAASAFTLVAAVWMGLMMLWTLRRASRRRALHERLGLIAPRQGPQRTLSLWRDGKRGSTTVAGHAAGASLMTRIRRAHYQAGLGPEAGPAVAGVLGAGLILGAGALIITGNPIVAACMPVFVVMAYSAWLSRRIRIRAGLFEQQFIHALELAARSLRAGHPLLGSFQLIADELDAPVSTAFAEVCQQHAMGVSLEDALERVAAATGGLGQDLRLFATSVSIQLRSGGNLADMMERLAFVIRDRLRLGRRIRILTSQTQFSKRILIAMPFVLFLVLNIVNREYAATLYTTPQGNILLGLGAAMMVLGIVAMNRLAILRY